MMLPREGGGDDALSDVAHVADVADVAIDENEHAATGARDIDGNLDAGSPSISPSPLSSASVTRADADDAARNGAAPPPISPKLPTLDFGAASAVAAAARCAAYVVEEGGALGGGSGSDKRNTAAATERGAATATAASTSNVTTATSEQPRKAKPQSLCLRCPAAFYSEAPLRSAATTQCVVGLGGVLGGVLERGGARHAQEGCEQGCEEGSFEQPDAAADPTSSIPAENGASTLPGSGGVHEQPPPQPPPQPEAEAQPQPQAAAEASSVVLAELRMLRWWCSLVSCTVAESVAKDPLDGKVYVARRHLARILWHLQRAATTTAITTTTTTTPPHQANAADDQQDGGELASLREAQVQVAAALLATHNGSASGVAVVIAWFRSLPLEARWQLPTPLVGRLKVLATRPAAYVINLARRADRWRDMTMQVR